MYTLKNFYHLLIRLLVALVASHFVVVNSAEETWLELFTNGYYYVSLIYSMVIAFLLIEYVYFVTKRVKIAFEEPKLIKKRVKTQFLFGFCIAAFLAFLMAMILFWINDENIFSSNYFERLYIYIVLFIFTLNVVYLLLFEYQKIPRVRYHSIIFDKQKLSILRIKAMKSNLPAVIYHENKAYFAIDFNGIKTSWPNTIEESMKLLHPENYFQISRKGIIHRAAVLSFSPYKIRCLRVVPNVLCPIELITSRRKAVFFKEWLT